MTNLSSFPSAEDIALIVSEMAAAYWGDSTTLAPSFNAHDSELWTAYVMIRGAWNGAMFMFCCRDFALKAASQMLGVDTDLVSDDDACCVVGEMTNVLGGNIKALISAHVGSTCGMSLPCVSQENGARFAGEHLEELWFMWRRLPFCVRLVQMEEPSRVSSRPIPHLTIQ